MTQFLNNLKARKLQAISYKLNRGMTYVELIVVLSIFSVMSAIVLYNYQGFQAKVDIKNMTSDIALKIVQAQKASSNGVLPKQTPLDPSTWKPSYGVYFNLTGNDADGVALNKKFIYFTDLDQLGDYTDADFCPSPNGSGECLDKITITKNDFIDKIEKCDNSDCSSNTDLSTSLISITFKRTNSGATFYSDSSLLTLAGSEYIQITVVSADRSARGFIKIYPSGRIQID